MLLRVGFGADADSDDRAVMNRKRQSNGTFAVQPIGDRFWGNVERATNEDSCWEWTGLRSEGYGSISYAGRMRRAHRVSWELHNGPIPQGLLVLHRCDNPPCVRPDHLFLGTVTDNNRDRAVKGRSADVRGWRSPKAKLTQAHVDEIRLRRANGESTVSLGTAFGVHHGTISRIAKRQTWTI